MTALSVIILSWNTAALLDACLRSLYDSPQGVDFEVLVVDNASEDGSAAMVEEKFPQAVLIRNEKNEGYARGNNIGLLRARGACCLLLNSDTEVKEGALESMVEFLRAHPSYGACGAQLVNPDGTIQRACMRFPGLLVPFFFDTFLEKLFPKNRVVSRYFLRDFDHAESADVDQPPGACFMVRRDVVDKVGYLDEDLFLFYNDVDYCKRVWEAGYRIRFLAEARVMHHIGASTRQYGNFGLEWHRNRVRYYRKHFGLRGTAATKCAALLKGVDLVIRSLRSGCRLRSPEVKGIFQTLREIWKT